MNELLLKFNGLSHWQIGALASLLLLQGFVISIFPEDVIITSLGLLCSRGRIGFVEACLFAMFGLLPANLAMVFMMNRYGRKLFHIRPFKWVLNAGAIERASLHFLRYGAWLIVFTRFIPLIRGPMYAAAGLSGLKPFRFFRFDALAACAQVPMLIYFGGKIGKNTTLLTHNISRIGMVIATIMILTLAVKHILSKLKARQERIGTSTILEPAYSVPKAVEISL